MLSLLLGIPLSLLPDYYRQRWFSKTSINFGTGALISGMLETGFSLWLFVQGYILYLHQGPGAEIPANLSVGAAIKELIQKTGQTAHINPFYGAGTFSLMSYFFHSLPMLLAYFAAEGFTRFVAALVTSESVGTLPLYLLAVLQQGIAFSGHELAYGRRVADAVESGDGCDFDIRISSCRPKDNWNRLMTIQYGEQFYEVVDQQQQGPPRRFVYLLKEKPSGKINRGLHIYSPLESLPGWARRHRELATNRARSRATSAK
jgi:hypothetical protein